MLAIYIEIVVLIYLSVMIFKNIPRLARFTDEVMSRQNEGPVPPPIPRPSGEVKRKIHRARRSRKKRTTVFLHEDHRYVPLDKHALVNYGIVKPDPRYINNSR